MSLKAMLACPSCRRTLLPRALSSSSGPLRSKRSTSRHCPSPRSVSSSGTTLRTSTQPRSHIASTTTSRRMKSTRRLRGRPRASRQFRRKRCDKLSWVLSAGLVMRCSMPFSHTSFDFPTSTLPSPPFLVCSGRRGGAAPGTRRRGSQAA